MHSVLSFNATSSGVLPSLFLTDISAFLSSNSFTKSVRPYLHATCSGVFSNLPRCVTSAPRCSNNFKTSTWPPRHAPNRGGSPDLFHWDTSAFLLSKNFRISILLDEHALYSEQFCDTSASSSSNSCTISTWPCLHATHKRSISRPSTTLTDTPGLQYIWIDKKAL